MDEITDPMLAYMINQPCLYAIYLILESSQYLLGVYWRYILCLVSLT